MLIPMGLSLAEEFAQLPESKRLDWIRRQPEDVLTQIVRGEWWWTARPEQIPPPGDWFIHLALAGRGWGKSRAGSEWLIQRTQDHPTDRHGIPTEWLVIAETLADARTICVEGPAGLLRVLERREIKYKYVKHPKPTILVGDTETRIYFEGADDADVGRGYTAAGAWLDEICIAKGELIVTEHGLVPVEQVAVGDLVMTRNGWRPVMSARRTERDAVTVGIVTDEGTIQLTPEHRVWTTRGWVQAQELRPYDMMLSWQQQMELSPPPPPTPRPTTNGAALAGTTTSGPDTTTAATGFSSIAPSGLLLTDRFPTGMRSTTSTGSGGTTVSTILSFLLSLSIGPSLRSNAPTWRGWKVAPSGRAGASPNTGSVANPAIWSALNAAPLSSPPGCEPNSAPHGAPIYTAVRQLRRAGTSDVYDLSVDGKPEFFAGSGRLLVHNCKWKYLKESWEEGIMPSLRADLVDDHPRVFVTTTPKPVDLIREWVARKDGSVSLVRGSTFDNRANLSAMTLEEMRKRYEGTAIGRQELYGELLENMDGVLFKYTDIEKGRVDEEPELEVARVCAVDPALTGEDDEMGIVIACRDPDNHIYVLSDESTMGSGRPAALHAWRQFAKWNCDTLLYESNLGKVWMEQVLSDAYKELMKEGLFPDRSTPPMKAVDSKHGKKTRAEPVAMRYEQGRVHHVGRFETLENQMVEWDPLTAKDSPDRLDALVHAVRHLMAGEKREVRIHTPMGRWLPNVRSTI